MFCFSASTIVATLTSERMPEKIFTTHFNIKCLCSSKCGKHDHKASVNIQVLLMLNAE